MPDRSLGLFLGVGIQMRVKADVVLKLFDLVNDSVVPEAALEACEELSDAEVAELLQLYVDAIEDAGERPSAFIKTAIRRLAARTSQNSEGEAPNS